MTQCGVSTGLKATFRELRLILGDQLNERHPWFETIDNEVLYVIIEARSETDYVVHHIQKVVAFFSAMRQFAALLEVKGHAVKYISIDDHENKGSITANLAWVIEKYKIQAFAYQEPDEYRLDYSLAVFTKEISQVQVSKVSSHHFLSERDEVKSLFSGKKTYRLETFYRHMRVKHAVLMEHEKPLGGEWNYDEHNRESGKSVKSIPQRWRPETEVSDIFKAIEQQGIKTIGRLKGTILYWPTTRKQAIKALDHFINDMLDGFGRFQDALVLDGPLMYHSLISFALNVKLISPLEVIQAAENACHKNPSESLLFQVEGFIRQILGWREYMRGVYWAEMPGYAQLNKLNHSRKLPEWFWTGNTKMTCLSQAINQSLDLAYAHHIQRLMVTGNFALLAGCDPAEVDAWYLGIYIDAIEWVEITNTRGMSQYADGGILSTKPYVTSANYINNMSNYCKGCYYDPKKRHGDKACPFNSLYYNFYIQHEERFAKNPRINRVYPTIRKMDPEELTWTLQQAEAYLAEIDKL